MQPPRPAPPPAAAPRQFPATAPDAAVMSARSQAREARTLADLEATLAGFDGCSLKATAKSLCFYRGAAQARLMLIGEAPGRDEDQQGKPFVGRAGQLLDKMLAAIALTEENVHITNIVYWRPPGNRTPTPQEAQVCRPFLERQVELVAPDVVVLLGGAAAKHIFDVPEGIMRVRGKFRDVTIGAPHGARTRHPASRLPLEDAGCQAAGVARPADGQGRAGGLDRPRCPSRTRIPAKSSRHGDRAVNAGPRMTPLTAISHCKPDKRPEIVTSCLRLAQSALPMIANERRCSLCCSFWVSELR